MACTSVFKRSVLRRAFSTDANPRKYWANKIRGFEASVWAEFTPLANKHNAVNLGQGFPDFEGANFILEGAKDALSRVPTQQYTRSQGHLRLVNALAKYYSPIYQRDIDPMTEIVTTVGATEALFATIQAFISPGDEVILIEPFYDSYPQDIVIAGGTPKYVPLRPSYTPGSTPSSKDWKLDIRDLEAAVTPKTKMIMVNNPQNVPGKIWSQSELEAIANIAKKHDLLVISDEVYEGMVYDDNKLTRMATLPGMWERTLSIGSAGKTFSVTGFKIGWVVGPKSLIEGIFIVHQNVPFCVPTPLQEAVAIGFEKTMNEEKKYFPWLKEMYQNKRDFMCNLLKNSGLIPIVPQGSYFVMADTSKINKKAYMTDPTARPDYQFCRWLTREIGVAAIPPSAFYSNENASAVANYARFAFCKKDETLKEAEKRVLRLKEFVA